MVRYYQAGQLDIYFFDAMNWFDVFGYTCLLMYSFNFKSFKDIDDADEAYNQEWYHFWAFFAISFRSFLTLFYILHKSTRIMIYMIR